MLHSSPGFFSIMLLVHPTVDYNFNRQQPIILSQEAWNEYSENKCLQKNIATKISQKKI